MEMSKDAATNRRRAYSYLPCPSVSSRLRTSASICFLFALAHVCGLMVPAASWTRQSSGTMAWLHSVYFLNEQRGWAAGSNGALLATTDGGEN